MSQTELQAACEALEREHPGLAVGGRIFPGGSIVMWADSLQWSDAKRTSGMPTVNGARNLLACQLTKAVKK